MTTFSSKLNPPLLKARYFYCTSNEGGLPAMTGFQPGESQMPFQTDHTWTPATYRTAHTLWAANAPATDGPIMPRDAHTSSPKHGKLSEKLTALMLWKHAAEPDEALSTSWLRYDLYADNDNEFEGEEPVPALLDSEMEIRPSVDHLKREWLGSKERPNVYRHGVAIEGDVKHDIQKNVPEYAVSKIEGDKAPRRDRKVVTKIGGLQFSNGEQTERAPVLKMNKVVLDDVRLPAGALVRYRQSRTWRKPSDCFSTIRAMQSRAEPTVGIGGHRRGSLPCPDTVVDREWALNIRRLVDGETARTLDHALVAANFREIGEAHGKHGKHAERYGRDKVIDACGKLDKILAANDNGYAVVAA